jgi:hypothetical protein
MSELVIREVDAKVDEVLDKVAAVDPRIAKVIADLDLKEIDWKNPLPHALRVSSYIQTEFKELKGKDKLELLTSVLKGVLTNSEISEEERTTALRFVDEILPVAVSAAVMVAKGEFDLKKALANPAEAIETAKEVAEVAMPYCLACWGFVQKAAKVSPPAQTTKSPLTSNPMHKPSE